MNNLLDQFKPGEQIAEPFDAGAERWLIINICCCGTVMFSGPTLVNREKSQWTLDQHSFCVNPKCDNGNISVKQFILKTILSPAESEKMILREKAKGAA